MRALIMGGTEFNSLHLVQSLFRQSHEVEDHLFAKIGA